MPVVGELKIKSQMKSLGCCFFSKGDPILIGQPQTPQPYHSDRTKKNSGKARYKHSYQDHMYVWYRLIYRWKHYIINYIYRDMILYIECSFFLSLSVTICQILTRLSAFAPLPRLVMTRLYFLARWLGLSHVTCLGHGTWVEGKSTASQPKSKQPHAFPFSFLASTITGKNMPQFTQWLASHPQRRMRDAGAGPSQPASHACRYTINHS